jgi:diacylglycerol kinase (ATP)
LGNGALEKLALIFPPMLVLSAELLNSAIEAVVDKVSPEFHELAGRAKDMGSAAVFVLLVLVVLSWGLILLPRWL